MTKKILGIIVVVIVLVLAAVFIFGSSDFPEESSVPTPPSLPNS